MESDFKERNKLLLRSMAMVFPRDFAYADRVVKHLGRQRGKRQGYKISRQMVYQTANGNSYNLRIAHAIAILYRFYRWRERRLNQLLEATALL